MLAREFGLGVAQPFAIGVHGKPAVPGRTSGSFNLSHCGRHALIGVSATHEIGVDIEEARRVPGAEAIAASHFSPGEISSMERMAGAGDSSSTFLDIWTRKEACLKALGCGFSVAAADVDVGDAPLETVVTPSSALASVRVASLTVGHNLVAAVACMEAR
ncbi:MAG: 4'-phosphopantetheinyl transferase superfamily protein [Steroidobacteraceae bacterium]